MAQGVPRDVVLKLRKLAQVAADLRHGQWFPVTRLTSLKQLCREPEAVIGFVTYLARKTLAHVEKGKGRAERLAAETARTHRRLMADALAAMQDWLQAETEECRRRLRDLLWEMRSQQNEHERIKWGSVRIIHDADLLLFEYAVESLLASPQAAAIWAYQTARHYAERYDSRHPSGLVPASAPLVQDIVDFWADYFGVDLTAPAEAGAGRRAKATKERAARGKGRARRVAFTQRQGQFLAFIHLYRKLHRQGPAELDMAIFFRRTPPSVHGMVVKLEQLGLITRELGVPRSARVAIPEEQIPELADVAGPPW
jgi:hypothetical protein